MQYGVSCNGVHMVKEDGKFIPISQMKKRKKKYETTRSVKTVTIQLARDEWQILKHKAESLGWRFPKLLRTLILKGLDDGDR